MSLKTWQRLHDLETEINDRFSNNDCLSDCPEGPRVHLVYAHFAVRVNIDEAMKRWPFATLVAYEKCAEPRHKRPARHYLGAHFLWVPAEDACLDKPPPTLTGTKAVSATAADGGTLIHFHNSKFNPKEPLLANVSAPANIGNWTMVDGYPPYDLLKDIESKNPFKPHLPAKSQGNMLSLVSPETKANYPKLRRLCLSVPGASPGVHKTVDADAMSKPCPLPYPMQSQDNELRLLAITPGFKFELRSKDGSKLLKDFGDAEDPWLKSTRDLGKGPYLWESSSNVMIGRLVPYPGTGNGLQRLVSVPGSTTTQDLNRRFSAQLGWSRGIIFKAVYNLEGACESVATCDGDKISWGINQWTGRDELWQILAFIYDFFPDTWAKRFGYFGIEMYFEKRGSIWLEKAHGPYTGYFAYRVPCCGSKTEAALEALFMAATQASQVTKSEQVTDTRKPPTAIKKLAEATRITAHDSTSLAMAYILTTAGTDPLVQEAMAQWMSYRISSNVSSMKEDKRNIGDVINKFVESLGSNEDRFWREAQAIFALGPEYKTNEEREAREYTIQRPSEKDSDYVKRLAVATAARIRPHLKDLLTPKFDDHDNGIKEWRDWATRCHNAGKQVYVAPPPKKRELTTQGATRSSAPTRPR